MKAVTDCSGSKGTDPTGTVIQVSPATGYKQSQMIPSSHTPHVVSHATFSLSHLPPNFCCPCFWAPHNHCMAQLLVTPLNYVHLTPSIQEINYLLTDRQILALFSGVCWTVPPRVQEIENCHGEYLYPPLKNIENYSLHWKATPWEKASQHIEC